MTTAFQSDAFQNNAFQIDAAVIVITPQPNQPAGGLASGPYGPAFPRTARSVRELYRQLPQQIVQPDQAAPEKAHEQPAAQLSGPSPLPIMMDLGTGPVMVGMMPSLKQAIEQQIIQDDEDAIVAILLSI